MQWTKVESSNIAEVGHDPEKNVLGIKFKNGGTYHYEGVSADQHSKLLEADSIGGHLHKHIKGKHTHSRIDAPA